MTSDNVFTPDERRLHAVLTRMSRICNRSASCSLSDCRRARRCVGRDRRCMWSLSGEPVRLTRSDIGEWRELMRQRQACAQVIMRR